MTTLKNSIRDEVLRRALQDAFAPRFQAIQARLEASLRQWLAETHSRFVELLADPTARKYLAVCSCQQMYFDTEEGARRAAAPVYGKFADPPVAGRYSIDTDRLRGLQPNDALLPQVGSYTCKDAAIYSEYLAVWADYMEARKRLHSLLAGYQNREKFEADFPEFARYLPARVVKVSPPAIIVADVRASLAQFGVPVEA